jgi:AcrR family transcriptional regulator
MDKTIDLSWKRGRMESKKVDRRIQRSQETLIQAILTLMKTNHYDQISVQDIVQQANVGRSTFYAHFQNKDDLVIWGFQFILSKTAEYLQLTEDNTITFDVTLLFKHAAGHYELYKTLIWGSGFELLIKEGQSKFSETVQQRLQDIADNENIYAVPTPILAQLLSGSLLILLKWWLDEKMPYQPQEMNEIFRKTIMEGISNLLPNK